MMAAGKAAELGLKVLLCEKNPYTGKKLGITGKGRCNVTNDCSVTELIKNIKGGGRFLYSAFNRFGSDKVIAFFEDLGVPLKTERGNRVFPQSDKASDIVDAMRKYMRRNGVTVINCRVTGILEENGSVCGVSTTSGDFAADTVIIATGGLSYPGTGSTGDGYSWAKKLGHSVSQLRPSLVELISDTELCGKCAGLALKNCGIKLVSEGKTVYEDFGELLFTHRGISGPTVLSASAHMEPGEAYSVEIDLKPALDLAELDRRITRDFEEAKNKQFRNSLDKLLPASLRLPFAELCGIDLDKQVNSVTREERRRIVSLLKCLPIENLRHGPIAGAIVTAGGVSTKEIKPSTMESKLVSRLFFAGEIIDADGYTGGFNLQIAFSTGYAAGIGAAESCGYMNY
ncbi:MAG: NAD(P)/FAD-dependent oxidoreductase [Clostridia bacterium]|nr:NAD(P)/FAD-dependent oxidoreductase [Clostridia bacterium]